PSVDRVRCLSEPDPACEHQVLAGRLDSDQVGIVDIGPDHQLILVDRGPAVIAAEPGEAIDRRAGILQVPVTGGGLPLPQGDVRTGAQGGYGQKPDSYTQQATRHGNLLKTKACPCWNQRVPEGRVDDDTVVRRANGKWVR